jgi:hypothetical protein
MKQAVCSILTPTTRRQICEFLEAAGSAGFGSNFSLLAKLCIKPQRGATGSLQPGNLNKNRLSIPSRRHKSVLSPWDLQM